MVERFGENNIIDAVVHKDEIHEYIDPVTKQKCISREHIHCFVIPEKDGQLCGKDFSSRANMKFINSAIHSMTQEKYGIRYMTGEYARHKSVEVLKNESLIAEQMMEIENNKKTAEQILDDADCKAGKMIADADVMAIKIKKTAKEQGFKEGEEMRSVKKSCLLGSSLSARARIRRGTYRFLTTYMLTTLRGVLI